MKASMIVLLLTALVATPAAADLVKKSSSGICHDRYSDWYERTKNYTEYGSLAACLETGGRLPRNYSGPGVRSGSSVQKAMEEARSEGRAFTRVYDRDDYNHWIDRDGDCQNERHELLIDSSQTRVTFGDRDNCYVETGRWYDPYTDQTYYYSSDLHIDHIVSLKYAHERGAHAWPSKLKERFANDRQNLIAVEAGTNQSKSDRGPSEWLPPNQQYRCEFLTKFDNVMDKYQLDYRAREERVINRMKNACRG